MRLAILLFKYFPYGGLQRNFRKITEFCLERGHHVDVYTLSWTGWNVEHPALRIHTVPVPAWRNHNRYRQFFAVVAPKLQQGGYDRVVGFNKMPGLDVYYCADPCFMERAMQRSRFYRLSGRFRLYAAFEQAVFNARACNRILLLSEAERSRFQRYYGTPDDRFHLMPPNVSEDRYAPMNTMETRTRLRQELGLSEAQQMLLMVGSDFRRKGVDRAIEALASLPEKLRRETHLYILGKGRETPFRLLARRRRIANQVHFLQGQDDVPRFLFSADLLLHTAYHENTGTAIVEAIAAKLPALVTANCGYAFHVERANSGLVVPEPFRQETLNRMLLQMLTAEDTDLWRRNAYTYAAYTELGSRAAHAVRVIELPHYGEIA